MMMSSNKDIATVKAFKYNQKFDNKGDLMNINN